MMRDDGRYRIADEPAPGRFDRVGTLSFLALPAVMWLAFTVSPLFLLTQGVLGIAIGGRHRRRDPALALLALFVWLALGVVLAWADGRLGLPWFWYLGDIGLSLAVLPLFAIAVAQQQTVQLRAAARA